MPYSFTITQTLTPVIHITEQARPNITVTDQNVVFTITQPPAVSITVNPTTYQFTATTNLSQIRTETLATAFRGEWSALTGYQRGDVVRYELAAYICNVANGEVINGSPSNPAPSGDARWAIFLGIPGTGTNGLSVGQIQGILRAQHMDPWSTSTTYQLYDWTWSTATKHTYVLTNIFGSLNRNPAQWPQYWTKVGGAIDGDDVIYHNVTVTNLLTVGGVRYPTTNGNLNQVLATNGENEANWVDVSSIALSTATRTTVGGIKVGPTLEITGDGILDVSNTSTQFIRYWELSSDLSTNGYNIKTGGPNLGLKVGVDDGAYIDFYQVTTPGLESHGIKINSDGGLIDIRTASGTVDPFVQINSDTMLLHGGSTGAVLFSGSQKTQFQSGAQFGSNPLTALMISSSGRIASPMTLDYALIFPDGSQQTTAYTGQGGGGTGTNYILPIAGGENGALGGVRIGDNINIDGRGVISVATPYTLPIATDSILGGVKIGAGVSINNGVISVTTGAFALQTATTAILGGVSIGNNINISAAGKISVSQASTSTLGVAKWDQANGIGITVGGEGILATATASQFGGIQLGTGLVNETLTPRVVNVAAASTTTFGGVILGNTLKVDGNGKLQVNTGVLVEVGNVSLTSNLITNGYDIKFSNSLPGSLVSAQQNNLTLAAPDIIKEYSGLGIYSYIGTATTSPYNFGSGIAIQDGYIKLKGSNGKIEITNDDTTITSADTIKLKGPYVQVGANQNNSHLQVGTIYNYNGSGPPLFPDGIQYSDLTVQVSAFQGYDWGQFIISTASNITSPLQVARAALEDVLAYTPAQGEPVYSTTTNQLFIGDGVTPGGILVATGSVTSGTNQITNQRLYTGSRVTFASVTATNLIDIGNLHLTNEDSRLKLSTGEIVTVSYESLLLLGDSLTDLTSSGATATLHGTATIVTVSTGSVKSPQTVFDLPGLPGSYISVPDNAGFYFGSGDFTIDCWFNARTAQGDTAILGQWGDGEFLFILHDLGNGPVVTVLFNSAGIVINSTPVQLNQWNHIAVSRHAGVIKVWTNGELSDSYNYSGIINNGTGNFYIGAQSANYANFNGYISHVRVTKGLSLFNAAFTPPKANIFSNTNEGDYLYDYELHTYTDTSALTTASIQVSSVKFNDGSILTSAGNSNVVTFNGTQLKTTVTTNITANVATEIDTVNISEFDSIEFLFKIKDGNNMQISKIIVLCDSTNIHASEYGITTNNGVLGQFTFGLTSGIMGVYFTPTDANNMTVKSVSTRISV